MNSSNKAAVSNDEVNEKNSDSPLLPLSPRKAQKIDTAKNNASIGFSAFSIPEALNFSIIFLMHSSKAFLDVLLSVPMRFISFPIAAICGLVKAGFNWYSFHKTRKDPRAKKEDKVISFLQALWETLNGLGTTGAVVTGVVGFFIGASVGMGISITFNFFLAASTAICGAYSVYYGVTAYKAYKAWKKAPPGEEKDNLYKEFKDRRKKAAINAAWAMIVGLLTVGVVFAMVLGAPIVGPVIGIIGCVCAAALSGYFLYKALKHRQELKQQNQNTHTSKQHDESHIIINNKLSPKIGVKSQHESKNTSSKSENDNNKTLNLKSTSDKKVINKKDNNQKKTSLSDEHSSSSEGSSSDYDSSDSSENSDEKNLTRNKPKIYANKNSTQNKLTHFSPQKTHKGQDTTFSQTKILKNSQ